MAIFHAHTKIIGRSTHDTVEALAYRSGTKLTCPRTGATYDYRGKSVPWVGLLLPKDAPEWIRDIQEEIIHNKRSGVQKFCNVVELAEKRVDAQVYREFEFALPRELTLEQNKDLVREFLQDQVCGMGIAVMANVHLEEDANGNPNPHCHALFLTRRLKEKGLSKYKAREWNDQDLGSRWRESLADYINFHLKMHGHDARVDHRSYAEQGIDLMPQPKRGWRGYFEGREGKRACHAQGELNQHISYNTAKILAHPEIVFETITKRQSTFMWGDVEAILAANIQDKWLFESLSERLLNSRELACVGEIKRRRHASAPIKDTRIYTTRGVRAYETSLISNVRHLVTQESHGVDEEIAAEVVRDFDERLAEFGGLSKDQKEALAHILAPRQLACVTGYAGTGKTTIVEAAKNVWEGSGYQVVGLAPTGRARDNLTALGLKAMTVHSFLDGYKNGRNQYKSDTVFVLDEAGMLDVEHFSKLSAAIKALGVKVVPMGDNGQLQAVGGGDAFRLVTDVNEAKHLTHVVRQHTSWQRKASRAFGEGNARQAVETYFKKGRIRVVDERVPHLSDLIHTGNMEGVVRLYNQTRRMTGNIYVRMREDMEVKMGVSLEDLNASLPHHPDWGLFTQLCATRRDCVEHMMGNLTSARPYMRSMGVDPVEFARTFTDRETDASFQSQDVTQFIHEFDLPLLGKNARAHVCDLRVHTRASLLKHWKGLFTKNPDKTFLISTNSKAETTLLNQELRAHLRAIKVLSGKEVLLTTEVTQEDSLRKTHAQYVKRSFARGDRLLFLKADKGLGVSNGDLGVLLKVSEKNVTVRLDSGKEVSFSPALYKNFDHGWAINIYKTQGLTVDYHFVLGSLQDYQNLSYVGMTRHRKDIFVYGSALEFWRPEVLLETLSKPRQKLTALDYGEEGDVALTQNMPMSQARLRASDVMRSGLYAFKQGVEDVGVRYFGMIPKAQDFFVPQGALAEHERAKELTMFAQLENTLESHPSQGAPSLLQNPSQQRSLTMTSVPSSLDVASASQGASTLEEATPLQGDVITAPRGALETFKKNLTSLLRGPMRDAHHESPSQEITKAPYARTEVFSMGERTWEHDGEKWRAKRQAVSERNSQENFERAKNLERMWRSEEIRTLHGQSSSLEGTPSAIYLSSLALTHDTHEDVRHVPEGTTFVYKNKERKILGGGALAVFARDKDGEITAVHLTSLTRDGTRERFDGGQEKRAVTYGAPKGSFLTLREDTSSTVYMAETLELGQILAASHKDGTIKVALNTSNMGSFETEHAKDIHLVVEPLEGRAKEKEALQDAVMALEGKGHTSVLINEEVSQTLAQKKEAVVRLKIQAQKEAFAAAKRQAVSADIRALHAQSSSLEGTPSERYLASLGLEEGACADVRHIPEGTSFTYKGQEKVILGGGALATFARDKDGEITSVQLTALTRDGARATYENGTPKYKTTLGAVSQSYARLRQDASETLYMCESLEAGLHLQRTHESGTVLVAMTLANMEAPDGASHTRIHLVTDPLEGRTRDKEAFADVVTRMKHVRGQTPEKREVTREEILEASRPPMHADLVSFLAEMEGVSQSPKVPERSSHASFASQLYEACVPLEGTHAQLYLDSHGLYNVTSPDILHVPRGTTFTYKDKERTILGGGALAVFARDKDGELAAVQLTHLDASDARQTTKDGALSPQITYGVLKGASVILQEDKDGASFVTQSVESGLMLLDAKRPGSIKVALSVPNMAHVETSSSVCLITDGSTVDKENLEKVMASLQKKHRLAPQHVSAQVLAKAHTARLEKEGIPRPTREVAPILKDRISEKEANPPHAQEAQREATAKLSPHEMRAFMESLTRHTDVAGLSMALMDDHGLPLNKALSKANALRFGNKGSIVVNTGGKNHGTWHSFEENKGGGLVQLVQHMKGGSFKEALSHMAPYVTGAARQDLEAFLGGEAPALRAARVPPPMRKQEEDITHTQEKANKHQEVKALVAHSLPVELTVASDYLKGRQLKKDAPNSVRFVSPGTSFTYQGKTRTVQGGGALLSCAVDETGRLQAAQLTYLDKEGARARNGEGNKFSKITFGSPKGAFVPLQKEEGPLYVAEGVETALSLREVGVKGTIVASLGITNMENLPAKEGRDVILVADWDGDGAPSHTMIEKAKHSLTQKGMNVRTLWPSKTSEHKLDFNDLLVLTTHEEIKDRIHGQHPDLHIDGRVAKDVVSEELKDLQNLFEKHNPRNPTFLKKYRSKLEGGSHTIIARGKREELSKQSQGLQDFVWHHFNEHEKRHNLVGAHSLELFMRHADALSKAKPLSAQHRDLKETLGELSHRMSQDARLMQEIASIHPHLLESIAAHTQNHLNTLQHAHTQSRGMEL